MITRRPFLARFARPIEEHSSSEADQELKPKADVNRSFDVRRESRLIRVLHETTDDE
jgi:hypothetical protein